jgi:anti-sigma regulatory factor (Ser/Thr protein kinase)
MLALTSVEREIRLRAEPTQLRKAREFADAAAGDYGLEGDDRYQFMFAANEATSNAIEHGSPCADGKIRLRVTEEEAALTFYVHDCGRFVADLSEPGTLPVRGRGLAVMAMLMDEFELKPGADGTVMRLSKRRSA